MAFFFKKALRFIELPEEEVKTSRWINDDIRPVPPERQNWSGLQYVELWFLVNMNISSYQTGSSLIASGMNVWQAIIVILVGDLIASILAVVNSISGAKSHMGYPIVSRSVWGMYGAYFPILNRILLSLVWYGVQAVIGGDMVYVCLRAIWPSIDNVPNTFPEKIGITVPEFIGYIIFNVICCVAIWFKPTKLRTYFHVGSFLVLVADLSLLIWSLASKKGDYGSVFTAPGTLKGSALGWSMCAGVMSVIGSIAAGILNQNDYTRFAKRTSQVTWTQGISFNCTSAFIKVVGVVVTAATQEKYGKGTALWNPADLLVAIQDQGGHRGRAASFFLAFAFIISQVSINVPGNVLAGGLDVASVFPKYINLRRGAYILAILSVAPNPWQQLASGSTFLSVLSAYAVFLGPFIGLLVTHYWIIQQRIFHVPDLYEGSKRSIYWYTYGVNWRTVIAWVAAVIPSMPGFVASVNGVTKVSIGATHLFDLSFLYGFFTASFISYVLHRIFPVNYQVETELEQELGDNTGSEKALDEKNEAAVTTATDI